MVKTSGVRLWFLMAAAIFVLSGCYDGEVDLVISTDGKITSRVHMRILHEAKVHFDNSKLIKSFCLEGAQREVTEHATTCTFRSETTLAAYNKQGKKPVDLTGLTHSPAIVAVSIDTVAKNKIEVKLDFSKLKKFHVKVMPRDEMTPEARYKLKIMRSLLYKRFMVLRITSGGAYGEILSATAGRFSNQNRTITLLLPSQDILNGILPEPLYVTMSIIPQ